mmetsp:Transcript_99517/g.138226  ORF Transcript_99517/g.138226 Transcript_99517/m.138226 type:complete len:295 (+) Transcript_99517:13-897(+)
MAGKGFCPIPHNFRDQVWLGVGAAVGLYAGYKLASSRPSKIGIDGLHLKYWAGRGLMEIPRQMLAINGVFPGQYTDGRYTTEVPNAHGFLPMKSVESTLSANLGRMPVCEVGGQSVGQSTAINYFIAAELDMLGDSTMETAQILSIQETLSEMKQAVRAIVDYPNPPTEEQLEMLFSDSAPDRSPAKADPAGRGKRYFKWFLGRLEYLVGSDGFAVGNRLSLADILLRHTLAENLPDSQCGKPDIASWRREPLMSAKRTAKLLEEFPKLKRIVENVEGQPGLARWLQIRGVQMF